MEASEGIEPPYKDLQSSKTHANYSFMPIGMYLR